ncbi:MAG TPA: hypothetical protein VGM27_14915 [Acidobacteriaceae bacterium]
MSKLENEAERKLSWPRITDSDTREAAEIEERRRAERVEIVGVVEGVEHLGIDYLFDPDMMSGAVRNLTRGVGKVIWKIMSASLVLKNPG